MSGPTELEGDLGMFSDAVARTVGIDSVVKGGYHIGAIDTHQAYVDWTAVWDDPHSRVASTGADFPAIPPNGALAGLVLKPGVYDAVGAINLVGGMRFEAGDAGPEAVWIIRAPGALTVAAAAVMTMGQG